MPKNHDSVRVRIAPSPTGRAHIANARAALFNLVFARQHGGELILRMEDTDRSRSTQASENDIMTQLTWLGLLWDKGPYRQTERMELYTKRAAELVAKGAAYKKEGAIYFTVDPTGPAVVVNDLIKGEVRFPRKEIPDFVIMRKDGFPVYHLAVVVDDIDMEISHVLRGEDHLTNTAKHILLFEAFGAMVPEFGHFPMILGSDGKKLSKRHAAVSIHDYRAMGYLPEALVNFIALLGWSPGEDEIIDIKKMVQVFHLERVSHHPAIFDRTKLDFLNGHYIRGMKLGDLAERIVEWAQYVGVKPPKQDEYLLNVLVTIQERMKRLEEFPELTKFYFAEPKYKADLIVFKKGDRERTKKGLKEALKALQTLKAWNRDEIQATLEAVVTANSLGNGDVFWPVRVAVTGEEASPPPVDVLVVLGREKSLKRIEKAFKLLK
jgi:glutamyl-tRNA synthetase